MFLFGASTSSHQIEGNTYNQWSVWEHERAYRLAKKSRANFGHLKSWPYIKNQAQNHDNYISGTGADHYNRFSEDFDIAKSLGHNVLRLSIEWSRIEPEEGYFDEKEIEHYKQVIKALKVRGIEPFVTLWHWTLPMWLCDKGGFCSKVATRHFEHYVEKMAKAFGKDVTFWVTLNEPEIYLSNSYLRGNWPPQRKNILKFLFLWFRLIKIHKKAYLVLKKINPEAKVGIAKNNIYFEPIGGVIDSIIAKIKSFSWNRFFLNRIKKSQDFIGLNYYFHNRIFYGMQKNKNEKVSDLGWELYPEGLFHTLMELNKYYKNTPIYITENGLADFADKNRAWFIEKSLNAVKKAIEKGVKVCGYMHWSLTDNFEWDKGFWPRFGLVLIDYKTKERKIRKSAFVYKKIIEEWKIK